MSERYPPRVSAINMINVYDAMSAIVGGLSAVSVDQASISEYLYQRHPTHYLENPLRASPLMVIAI